MEYAREALAALSEGRLLSTSIPYLDPFEDLYDDSFEHCMSLQSDTSPLRKYPAHEYEKKLQKSTAAEIETFNLCYRRFIARIELMSDQKHQLIEFDEETDRLVYQRGQKRARE